MNPRLKTIKLWIEILSNGKSYFVSVSIKVQTKQLSISKLAQIESEHRLATFQVLKIKLSLNLIEKRFRGELKLLHWQNIKPLDIFDEALL